LEVELGSDWIAAGRPPVRNKAGSFPFPPSSSSYKRERPCGKVQLPSAKPPLVRVPGLSPKVMGFILRKVHGSVRDKSGVLVNQTFNELYGRQEQRPLELFDRDLKKLAARYGELVREAAGKLTTELCEALTARERLTEGRLHQIRLAFKEYIRELTSAASAKILLNTTVVQYYTVAECRQAEQRLTRFMRPAGFRRLLEKNAEEELDYAKAKFYVKGKARQGKSDTRALPPKGGAYSNLFDAAKLTDRQREVLSLKYEYGLSVSEIARRLGLHRKTVDEHIARAIFKLKSAKGAEYSAMRRAITEPGNLS